MGLDAGQLWAALVSFGGLSLPLRLVPSLYRSFRFLPWWEMVVPWKIEATWNALSISQPFPVLGCQGAAKYL